MGKKARGTLLEAINKNVENFEENDVFMDKKFINAAIFLVANIFFIEQKKTCRGINL